MGFWGDMAVGKLQAGGVGAMAAEGPVLLALCTAWSGLPASDPAGSSRLSPVAAFARPLPLLSPAGSGSELETGEQQRHSAP